MRRSSGTAHPHSGSPERSGPYTIHDTTLRPGQRIITLLASAARDEREYADPDEFVWNRPIERLLSFGHGQHFCLGVHVARLEIAIMIQEFLRRVPDYRIAGDQASRPPSSFQWGWKQHSGGGVGDVVPAARRPVHLRTDRHP